MDSGARRAYPASSRAGGGAQRLWRLQVADSAAADPGAPGASFASSGPWLLQRRWRLRQTLAAEADPAWGRIGGGPQRLPRTLAQFSIFPNRLIRLFASRYTLVLPDGETTTGIDWVFFVLSLSISFLNVFNSETPRLWRLHLAR